jgi:DNA polymerase III sliding clamp (beta) subunit (PCNA family)
MLLIPRNLAALAEVVTKDQARWASHCVHVLETPTGYRAEATDGRGLVVVTGPGRFAGVESKRSEALIPAKEWAQALKGFKGDAVALVLGKKAAGFSTGEDDAVRVKLIEGRYPPVDTILPAEPPRARFRLNALLFAKLLKVVAAFTDDDHAVATIKFWDEDKPIWVSASNENGQVMRAAQMPCSPEPEEGGGA